MFLQGSIPHYQIKIIHSDKILLRIFFIINPLMYHNFMLLLF